MMVGFALNPPSAPLVDQTGAVTPEWFKFFLSIQRMIGSPVSPFDDSTLLAATPLLPQSFDDLLPPVSGQVLATRAAAGANSDITALSGLSTPLSVAQGGTGQTTLAALAENVRTTGSLTTSGLIAGIGYATGAGATASQATSKATAVTMDRATGSITLNAAALGANTTVSFTFTSSAIAATDLVLIGHVSGGTIGAYTVTAFPAAGSATIAVRNVTAGALGEAIVLRFAVVKSVDS